MPTTTAKKTSNTHAAKKTSAKTKAPASHSAGTKAATNDGPDAIELLKADHKEVKQLFKDYEKLISSQGDDEEKQALATKICTLLTVHATIEEEIFYPATRASIQAQDLLDEAEVEHAGAKDLIAQIQGMQAGDPLYDAKVTVLGEYIDHHVKEEEGEMFPKVKKSNLDLDSIGQELSIRKEQLLEAFEGEAVA